MVSFIKIYERSFLLIICDGGKDGGLLYIYLAQIC